MKSTTIPAKQKSKAKQSTPPFSGLAARLNNQDKGTCTAAAGLKLIMPRECMVALRVTAAIHAGTAQQEPCGGNVCQSQATRQDQTVWGGALLPRLALPCKPIQDQSVATSMPPSSSLPSFGDGNHPHEVHRFRHPTSSGVGPPHAQLYIQFTGWSVGH